MPVLPSVQSECHRHRFALTFESLMETDDEVHP